MNKVKIIADSGCNVDLAMAKQYNISIIPFNISFEDESYIDLYELTSVEFFEKFRQSEGRVSTSVPSIGSGLRLFEDNYKEGYRDFIVFTIGKEFSGMHQMMILAAREFLSSHPDCNIKIIDTRNLTIAAMYPVLRAATYAEAGNSLDEIYEKSLANLKYQNIYGVAKDLFALARGGRLPKSIARFASLISFSPVLQIEEGAFHLVKKTTGKKKAYKELTKTIKNLCKTYDKYILVIGGAGASDKVTMMKDFLEDEVNNAGIYLEVEITPVIGVHTGDGAVLCSVFPLE